MMLNFLILLNLFIISSATEERILKIHEMEFYEDKSRMLTLEEVTDPELDIHFDIDPDFVPADFNPSSAYWVKITLDIPDNDKDYLIEFFDQTIDTLTVYVKEEGSDKFRTHLMGDNFKFSQKNFLHKNFEVPLGQRGKYTCYIRLVSHEYADIRFSIRTFNFFIQYSTSEYFIYGIFYGMILIISLYNTLIYFAIRELKYLYYTFYILSVGMYAMCVDGIAYQYLWPSNPAWNQIAYGVALFLVIFWSIIFSKRFLRLKIRSPKINRVLNVVLILRIALFVYTLLFDHHLFQIRNIELIPLVIIFFGGISVYSRGYEPARFFVVAYGILFLGFFFKALMMLSVIPVITLSYYSLHIAFVLEMLFLSYALSDRVRILKSNRDRALRRIISQHEENARFKDQVNARLEKTVNDRTKELIEKNEQLLRQTKEISQINSLLDLDNWRLRNNIKSIQRERLLNIEMTYEQFKEVFSDKEQCMKALSNYKWEKGYACIKCGNRSYSEMKPLFGKRCSKCGYHESATTNTLFHGVKFPIEKAFYILYVTINKNTHTLSELSDILEIRRNTISDFKKRINSLEREDHIRLQEIFHKIDPIMLVSQK